jgi:hypothetical protein
MIKDKSLLIAFYTFSRTKAVYMYLYSSLTFRMLI